MLRIRGSGTLTHVSTHSTYFYCGEQLFRKLQASLITCKSRAFNDDAAFLFVQGSSHNAQPFDGPREDHKIVESQF
jgi:hypothetical protein